MEQLQSKDVTVITLKDFPQQEIPNTSRLSPEHFAEYVSGLLLCTQMASGSYIELPAISAMSSFFKSSNLEVYDGLKALRSKGYDYHFSHLDDPIRIWKTKLF